MLTPEAELHNAASCKLVGPEPFQEFERWNSSSSGCTERVCARPVVRGDQELGALRPHGCCPHGCNGFAELCRYSSGPTTR